MQSGSCKAQSRSTRTSVTRTSISSGSVSFGSVSHGRLGSFRRQSADCGTTRASAQEHRERRPSAHRHPASVGSQKLALQEQEAAASRAIDDALSQQEQYEAVLRKTPASRTPEELQLLVGWARQIEFKDDNMKKSIRFELLLLYCTVL